MKNKIIKICSIFIFALVVSFIGYRYTFSQLEQALTVKAEWTEEASTIEELINKSDMVVVGKPHDLKSAFKPFKDILPEIIYSNYNVDIKYILKGDDIENKNIPVINYGAEIENNKRIEFDGVEELKEDNLYLLFLEKLPEDIKDERAGKYRPIDGPSGTYELTSIDKKLLKSLENKEKLNKNELKRKDLKLTVEEVELTIQQKILDSSLYDLLEIVEINYIQNVK